MKAEHVPHDMSMPQRAMLSADAFLSPPTVGSHFRLHGNPGDYAWGNAELDRIVTQLLNQLDSSGPPPLGQALIQRLPTVTITQASVGEWRSSSDCPL